MADDAEFWTCGRPQDWRLELTRHSQASIVRPVLNRSGVYIQLGQAQEWRPLLGHAQAGMAQARVVP